MKVCERGVQYVHGVEITRVRGEMGSWSLTGGNLGMANQWERKNGGDGCVCFVCGNEKCVL